MKKSNSEEMSKNFELDILREEIKRLKEENLKLKKIVSENELDEEIDKELIMSDEESICVNEIKKLKKLSDLGGLSHEDVKTLDILHKNLRMIRGQSVDAPKKSKKKASVQDLFKIVEGENA